MTSKRKLELNEKLRKLNEREQQLKNQLKAIDAKEKEADRKRETRAKIILGGYLVSQYKKGDQKSSELLANAVNHANDRDKKALQEFKKIIDSF